MGTMTSSSASSKLFTNKFRAKTFCSSRFSDVDKFPEIRFFRFEKLAAASCANLSNFSLRPVSSLFSSSQPQVEFEPAETEVPEQYEFPTVHFKFQLQRQCEFGEQFFIVGSDSVLGLWNPLDAIPMSWSDGHVWTTELDIPIGKSIKFKFILRQKTGQILWQPGPDRILHTLETKKTINVFEDWENAEFQQITEESVLSHSEESIRSPEKLTTVNEAKNLEIENTKDPMAAHEINHSYDDPMVMVAENIACPNTYDRMHASYRSEGNAENSTILQNTAESIAVESNERETRGPSLHSTVAEGKLETCYEVPVLVPGLIPCFEMETKDVSREDGLKCDFDTSAYADDAVPEIDQGNRNELPLNEEKNESGIDDGNPQNEVLTEAVIDHGRKPCDVEPVREATNLRKDEDPNEVLTEAVIDDDLKPCHDEPGQENTNSRKDEDPNDSNSVQNTLLKNDINWSQKTLKKLLNRLRFL